VLACGSSARYISSLPTLAYRYSQYVLVCLAKKAFFRTSTQLQLLGTPKDLNRCIRIISFSAAEPVSVTVLAYLLISATVYLSDCD